MYPVENHQHALSRNSKPLAEGIAGEPPRQLAPSVRIGMLESSFSLALTSAIYDSTSGFLFVMNELQITSGSGRISDFHRAETFRVGTLCGKSAAYSARVRGVASSN